MRLMEEQLEEPNLRAYFFGGRIDGWEAYFAQAYPEFNMVAPVRDDAGKEIGKEVLKYRLASNGPPLRYEFVGIEPE